MQLHNDMYIIILVFAILLQATLLIFTNLQMDMRGQTKRYRWLILCSIFICFSDIFARLSSLENDHSNIMETLSFFFNSLYFLAHVCVAVLWFFYALREIGVTKPHKPWEYILTMLPALLLIVFIMVTGATGWLFTIDQDNVYHRGDLFLLHPVVCLGYMLVPSVLALQRLRLNEYYIHRSKLVTIAIFSLLVLPFVVLQAVLGDNYPLFCVGFTLALLLLHMNRQNMRITIDELTGVSNRSQSMRYLSYKMNAPADPLKQPKSLYVMMVDIDKFKHINDTYGHVEGDEALKRTASVLKKSVPRSFFIGRYGGDEFIIIGDADRETAIMEVCQTIYDNLEEANKEAMTQYNVSVSIGYSVRNGQISTIPEFIRQADRKLYFNKNFGIK